MPRRWMIPLGAVVLLGGGVPAVEAQDAATALARAERAYRDTRTLRAGFEQTSQRSASLKFPHLLQGRTRSARSRMARARPWASSLGLFMR